MQDAVVQWFVTGLGMALWGVPFVALLFYISSNSIKAYLAKKGENLATKEDIGVITKEVEKAKEEFNHRLEDLKAHHQLRMVAAERRLQAHQEAYVLWYKMVNVANNVHYETRTKAMEEFQDWFLGNCVYMGNMSRKAIVDSFSAAENYLDYVQGGKAGEAQDAQAKLWEPGRHILEEVELPPFPKEVLQSMSRRDLQAKTPA